QEGDQQEGGVEGEVEAEGSVAEIEARGDRQPDDERLPEDRQQVCRRSLEDGQARGERADGAARRARGPRRAPGGQAGGGGGAPAPGPARVGGASGSGRITPPPPAASAPPSLRALSRRPGIWAVG